MIKHLFFKQKVINRNCKTTAYCPYPSIFNALLLYPWQQTDIRTSYNLCHYKNADLTEAGNTHNANPLRLRWYFVCKDPALVTMATNYVILLPGHILGFNFFFSLNYFSSRRTILKMHALPCCPLGCPTQGWTYGTVGSPGCSWRTGRDWRRYACSPLCQGRWHLGSWRCEEECCSSHPSWGDKCMLKALGLRKGFSSD